MEDLNWIKSEGGPLIIMEKALQPLWGGVFRLSDVQFGAKNDYDRLNMRLHFIQSIALKKGEALVLGEGPLDTAFWCSKDRQKFLVRVIYCETEFDANTVMLTVDDHIFADKHELIEFYFESSDLVMFDSAEDGAEPNIDSVSTSIEPGRYQILTKVYEPDEFTSLVLHRFDRIT